MNEYINPIRKNLDLNDSNIKMQIMGIEGKASNDYWNAVKYFIPKEIGFES